MSLRERFHRSDEPVSTHEAVAALAACPPPWEPIDRGDDERYRQIVAEYGPSLLQRALARPEGRAWLLVRYLPDVPPELVERCLAAFKQESAEFCELAGGTPDVAVAETWEAQWRTAAPKAPRRHRAAS
jgi:hypothetical protein